MSKRAFLEKYDAEFGPCLPFFYIYFENNNGDYIIMRHNILQQKAAISLSPSLLHWQYVSP